MFAPFVVADNEKMRIFLLAGLQAAPDMWNTLEHSLLH